MRRNKSYASLKHKNFRQSFIQMLENDFKLIGSGKVIEILVDNAIALIEKFMPEKIPPGSTMVSAISKDAPKGHNRGVKGLPLVPVRLTVINEKLINRYANNEKTRQIKRDYVISLFKEAYAQGGVLSSADVALLMKMSQATISKYVRDYMESNDDIVPTRGFIHDIGPSISHKGIIVGRFLRGELPDKVAKATNHSLQAVDRYIRDYERVKICINQKMEVPMIKSATGMSKKLINKYKELYYTYEGEKNDQAS